MVVVDTTKIYANNQTTIPKQIRKKLNLTKDMAIDWDIDENMNVKLIFRKPDLTINDLIGVLHSEKPTYGVKEDRELYL